MIMISMYIRLPFVFESEHITVHLERSVAKVLPHTCEYNKPLTITCFFKDTAFAARGGGVEGGGGVKHRREV